MRACKTSKILQKNDNFFIHLRAYFLKIFICFPVSFYIFPTSLGFPGKAALPCVLQYSLLDEEPLLGAAALLQQPLPVLPPYP
jgi:hypothetical protein